MICRLPLANGFIFSNVFQVHRDAPTASAIISSMGGLINSNERLATRYHPCRRPSLSERSRATDGAKESWSELFLPKGVAYVKSLLESVVWFVEKQLEMFHSPLSGRRSKTSRCPGVFGSSPRAHLGTLRPCQVRQ